RAPAIRRRCAVSVPALVTTRDEQACREWHEQEKNAPAECRGHRPPNFFLARTPTLVVRRGAAQSDGRPLAGDLAAFYSDYVGSQEHRTHHRRFSVARFVSEFGDSLRRTHYSGQNRGYLKRANPPKGGDAKPPV